MKVGFLTRHLHNFVVAFKGPPYTKGFANRNNPNYADEHFQKHKSLLLSIGITSPEEYEKRADKFCGGKIEKNTLVCKRPKDGARILYNTITNEFGFLSDENVIITYFVRPRNQAAYFQRECSATV